MAPDQPAPLEVLHVPKTAKVDDRIRHAAETIYQALIEAELTAMTGGFPHQRTKALRHRQIRSTQRSRQPPGSLLLASRGSAPK